VEPRVLVEFIMNRCGWDTVWFLSRRMRTIWRKGACLVGVWTGPDRDLLCVRRCETVECQFAPSCRHPKRRVMQPEGRVERPTDRVPRTDGGVDRFFTAPRGAARGPRLA